MSKPLFHQLLDENFNQLPRPIQYLHGGLSKVFTGKCDVERGTGTLSRLLAWIISLPHAGSNQLIEVTINCSDHGEIWTRRFGNQRMTSSLSAQGRTLVERLGPMNFKFMFAAMQSEAGRQLLVKHGLNPDDPMSFLLIDEHGRHVNTDAIIRILTRLDGGWKLGVILRVIPPAIRDPVYRAICP